MNKCIKCGSYAFNLHKDNIDQGSLCDVHYWQGRAHRAEAQPEQVCRDDGRCQYAIDSGAEGMGHCPKGKCIMPSQPEQEPVAVKHMMEWVDYLKRKSDYGQHMKISSEMSAGACWELAIELEQFINTTPPQRKPLTDEQIDTIRLSIGYAAGLDRFIIITRSIEAAHGIKE